MKVEVLASSGGSPAASGSHKFPLCITHELDNAEQKSLGTQNGTCGISSSKGSFEGFVPYGKLCFILTGIP